MNSRASKNIAMSKGRSIKNLVVGGLKKMKDRYMKNHKIKQDNLNKHGYPMGGGGIY